MHIIPLHALKDNYIWAIIDKQNVVIVDPGEAQPVLEFLKNNHYQLSGIFITHHHGDHTHGIEAILNELGDLPVYGSHKSPIKLINRRVKDGDQVTCAHFTCRAMEIPGHTLDHTAFYSEKDQLVFTGDTLFSAGCGRIFEGDPAMMYASLQKLAALPDNTRVYCGHEYTKSNLQFAQVVEPYNTAIISKIASLPACTLPSTIGEEKKFNPFLRCHEQTVVNAVNRYSNESDMDIVKVFGQLREWKNSF